MVGGIDDISLGIRAEYIEIIVSRKMGISGNNILINND